MKTYIEKDGNLVEKKTGKVLTTLPQFQVARPKIRMLGDLAIGANFTHDGDDYRKITHNTEGNIACLKITGKPGRPSRPCLPHWLLVKV